MRCLAALTATFLALGFAACGGDDETTSTAGASGATGAQSTADTLDLTAGEYLAASIPDQLTAVEDAVEANPECAEVDTSPGGDFQVAVAIDAASADPDQALAEIVAENC
ncbi:MAG TPA: hypothetical protein VD765_01025 [Solirubrobacterales bacterium]|nr:hypothetical protein [Solirubrobacterales bacterium]